MYRVQHFMLLILVSVFVANVSAQPAIQQTKPVQHSSGVISGTIVDVNGQNLQYASVNVKKVSDSTTVQYGITDTDGSFRLEDIPFGKYFLEIQYVGYQKSISQAFEISKENAVYKITKYKMTDKNSELETVVIKAQRDMLQTNLDKTVFNVSSSITAQGATASEIIDEIPSVQVDMEGNVSLRGSENVTILIDGHSTNLTLDEIPAEMVESVEVITNPSARLEPDGMAGILNVILKKKKESGFNGLIGIGGSTSFFDNKIFFSGYNGNLSFNYRYNKFNLFVSYGIRDHSHQSSGTLDRDAWSHGDTNHLAQSNYRRNGALFQNVSVGMDYAFNKYNTLSLNVGGDFGRMVSKSTLNSQTDSVREAESYPVYKYVQIGQNRNRFYDYDVALNYKKTFETKGRELTSDIYYSESRRPQYSDYLQNSLIENYSDYYQYTQTKQLNRDATAQVDFVTPVGNGGRIETGYKFSYRGVGQDYSLYDGMDSASAVLDSSQLNNFYYSSYINALYFIYSNTFWKKLKVQAGLRGEIANTVSDLRSADTAYPFNYYNLFPTVHLKYEITPEHAIQLSYSRRVTRPSIYQLNPFIDYSDKENLSQGNPYLEPEFANSLELGYAFNKNQTSITLTAFYRRRTNLITRYTEVFNMQTEEGEPYSYTMTSYQNLNKSQNFGLEFFLGQRIKKFWKLNLTGSFYRNIIDSDHLLDENLSRDWAWNAGLNQTFSLAKNFDIQLNFRYRSSSLTAGSMGWGTRGIGQGRRSASYRLNLGIKKGFIHNSLVVSLNVRNLLYFIPAVRIMEVESWSGLDTEAGYNSYSTRESDGFNISLNMTYKLNNYKARAQKISEDEEMQGGEM